MRKMQDNYSKNSCFWPLILAKNVGTYTILLICASFRMIPSIVAFCNLKQAINDFSVGSYSIIAVRLGLVPD